MFCFDKSYVLLLTVRLTSCHGYLWPPRHRIYWHCTPINSGYLKAWSPWLDTYYWLPLLLIRPYLPIIRGIRIIFGLLDIDSLLLRLTLIDVPFRLDLLLTFDFVPTLTLHGYLPFRLTVLISLDCTALIFSHWLYYIAVLLRYQYLLRHRTTGHFDRTTIEFYYRLIPHTFRLTALLIGPTTLDALLNFTTWTHIWYLGLLRLDRTAWTIPCLPDGFLYLLINFTD
jgi:hypothetical protein